MCEGISNISYSNFHSPCPLWSLVRRAGVFDERPKAGGSGGRGYGDEEGSRAMVRLEGVERRALTQGGGSGGSR